MNNLRSKLIRLAHKKPELRSKLLPLLEKTASPSTSIAKVVLSTPGFESVGKRGAMAIAKEVYAFFLKALKEDLKEALTLQARHKFSDPEVDYSEYEAYLGTAGGPSSGPAGFGDEGYYDVTETREYEYPVEAEVKADLEIDFSGVLRRVRGVDFGGLDERKLEEDLFNMLTESGVVDTIVRDGFKNQWGKWFEEYVGWTFEDYASEEVESYNSDIKVDGKWKPNNIAYKTYHPYFDRSVLRVTLVLSARFGEPKVVEQDRY